MRKELLKGMNIKKKEVKEMKKWLIVTMCLSCLLAVAVTVNAISLPLDLPAVIKYTDYTPHTELSQELWSIAYVTEIYQLGNPANVMWEDNPGSDELTVMFYNLHMAVDYTAGLTQPGYIYFNNFSAGPATMDLWDDGEFAAFLTSYNPTGGPGARTGMTTYPTVTDGTKYMSLDFLPVIPDLVTGLFYEYRIFWDPVVQRGQGTAFFDVIPGSGPGSVTWNTGTMGTPIPGVFADFILGADLWPGAGYGWAGWSEDPVIGRTAIPEPSTLLLVGSGLLALAAFGRKRFFKK